jgi:uncharacterized protein (TIGR03437 family)
LSFDGSYLWVGEYKFSGRLLRFPPSSEGQAPRVNAGGVVSGASFQNALAGGALVSLFGSSLAGSGVSSRAERFPLPSTLQGTTVRVNNTPAPLLFVSPTQINFQMPWQAAEGPASLTVTTPSGASAARSVTIGAVAPDIFTLNTAGQGAILLAASGEPAAPAGSLPGRGSRPARRGEVVSIFCTGLGAVANPPQNGDPASAAVPSPVTRLVQVRIGGVLADASFAGLAPGFVALYQVNVRIPDGVAPGNTVPLQLVTGAVSNTVTMAVE